MSRAVIIGGAPIGDYAAIREYFDSKDFYIFCDSGLYHKQALGVTADLVIGDFDSHEKPSFDVETIVLPTVKDDTDTVYAMKEALRRGFDEFLFIGTIGARLDHTLGNLYMLVYLDKEGKRAVMADDYSQISVISGEKEIIDKKYKYFSLINIDGSAGAVTIKGAKYNLDGKEIPAEYQYGVSNQVDGDFATVSVDSGRLLVIKVK